MMSAALNLAIGLSFIWLLVSLAVMFVTEWIGTRFQWRARMLEEMIQTMLGSPSLTDQFYNHPLIRSLFSGNRKPSYIPPRQFTLALMDLVKVNWTDAALYQQQLYGLQKEIWRLPRGQRQLALEQLAALLALTRKILAANNVNGVQNMPADSIENALRDFGKQFPALAAPIESVIQEVKRAREQIQAVLTHSRRNLSPTDQAAVQDLRLGVDALTITQPRLRQTLAALLQDALPQSQAVSLLERFQKNVEFWFQNSMDRLNGAYKRRAYVLSVVIGLTIAVLANIDGLALASHLWNEPQMQAALVVQAQLFLEQNPQGTAGINPDVLAAQLQKEMGVLSLPLGWFDAPESLVAIQARGGACSTWPLSARDVYGFLLGNWCIPFRSVPAPGDWLGWFLKGLGWLSTAIAAGQGAPFWFDVLKKIVNVRLSGPAPVS
jgi:hypothetical protein